MAKKRIKKYKPKPVRTPVVLFKVWPELSEGQRAELDVHPLSHIDAMPGKSSSAKSPAPAIAIRATPMRQGSVAALSPPGIGMDSR